MYVPKNNDSEDDWKLFIRDDVTKFTQLFGKQLGNSNIANIDFSQAGNYFMKFYSLSKILIIEKEYKKKILPK